MKISIIGAGNMGTAISLVLNDNNNEIILWSIEESVVNEINNKHVNSKYLSNNLPKNIIATGDLKIALKNADFVVFSVPSHVIRSVAKDCKDLISKNSIIVNLSKGLEKDSNKRMSEILSEYFKNPIISVGGPSIANELANNIPTFAVFSSKNIKALNLAKKVFEKNYYNISISNDIIGVELGGVLKNIIAILAGISDGLGYGFNTKAGIISKGLNELKIVSERMGAKPETMDSLAGLGDLIVTCTSKESRNRSFGELIGKGFSKTDAVKKLGQVVEGVKAVEIVKVLIDKNKLKCPLINKVYNILFEGEKANV